MRRIADMSRGKQGIFTIVAALATVATMAVAPASL
jgi:hypothetical protein